MRKTASEIVYKFPNAPFYFRLSSDAATWVPPKLAPFPIEPHQALFPRSFANSDHVIECMLPPALASWLALEVNTGDVKEWDLLGELMTRHMRQSLQWLSSTHGDGFRDIPNALEAFMKVYLFRESKSLRDPKLPQGRGWSRSQTHEGVCAEAILKDEPISSSGSPYNCNARAVLVFTAPELLPTPVLDAIVKSAPSYSLQLNDDKRVATPATTETEVEHSAQAQWWLTHMWRRLTYLQVRMAILTTTVDTIVFYLNEGVIQVTNRFTNCYSEVQPLTSRLPFFLAVHLLAEGHLAIPQEYREEGEKVQETESLNGIWKKIDRADPRPRLEGVEYAYEPSIQTPADGETVVDFDLAKSYREARPTLISSLLESQNPASSTEPETGSASKTDYYDWKEPLALSELGAPTIFLTPSTELKEWASDPAHSRSMTREYARGEALFRGPIDYVNKVKDALPSLLIDPVEPSSDSYARSADQTGEKETQGLKLPQWIKPQHLVLGKPGTRGDLWDCYPVTAAPGAPPLPFPLFAKLAWADKKVSEVEEIMDGVSECEGVESESGLHYYDNRVRIVKHLKVLHEMRALQGTVIPRVVGLWCTVVRGKELWMLLQEDVGRMVDTRHLSEAEKQEMRDLFVQLHHHNFVHGNVRHKSIRKGSPNAGGPGSMRLIDFGDVRSIAGLDRGAQEFYKKQDMKLVESLFSYWYPEEPETESEGEGESETE